MTKRIELRDDRGLGITCRPRRIRLRRSSRNVALNLRDEEALRLVVSERRLRIDRRSTRVRAELERRRFGALERSRSRLRRTRERRLILDARCRRFWRDGEVAELRLLARDRRSRRTA